MAKKTTSTSSKSSEKSPRRKTAAPVSKEIRNTAIPRSVAAAARPQVTSEQIALRAYEISQSSACGSCDENWYRAERELRGQI
jgi:hypothetical protein